MSIVDLIPSVDQSLVVVCPLCPVPKRSFGTLDSGGAIYQTLPRLVRANEMDGFDSGTEAFVRRGVAGDTASEPATQTQRPTTHVYAAVGVVL